jgi:hypothetical protein
LILILAAAERHIGKPKSYFGVIIKFLDLQAAKVYMSFLAFKRKPTPFQPGLGPAGG